MKIKMLLIKNINKKVVSIQCINNQAGRKRWIISKTDIDMYLLLFKGTIQTLSTGWIGWGFISATTCSTALQIQSRIGNAPISFNLILLFKRYKKYVSLCQTQMCRSVIILFMKRFKAIPQTNTQNNSGFQHYVSMF